MAKSKHIGSRFEDFLAEEGLLEAATDVAMKRVLAWQLETARKTRGLSKTELANRMETSRSAVDRLLDEHEPALTLETLSRAVQALGARLKIEVVLDKVA